MDIKFMQRALELAAEAAAKDEVPIGAVIVKDGQIIAEAHNLKEEKNCALYHAETIAIARACQAIQGWRLIGCDLYVTLEPCAMCAGALINSRIENIYFGAYDEKAGCCATLYNLPRDERFNHRPAVKGGIMEAECAKLLSDFFKSKRK